MRPVHNILAAFPFAITALLAGCSTTETDAPIAPFHAEEPPPADKPGVEMPRPKGSFLGDMRSRVFHRPECRDAKTVPEIEQVTFDTPWPAINEGFEPCRRCYPMTGWK